MAISGFSSTLTPIPRANPTTRATTQYYNTIFQLFLVQLPCRFTFSNVLDLIKLLVSTILNTFLNINRISLQFVKISFKVNVACHLQYICEFQLVHPLNSLQNQNKVKGNANSCCARMLRHSFRHTCTWISKHASYSFLFSKCKFN